VTRRQWPHWLALAGVARFFTQKSHALLERSYNAMISNDYRLPSGIFDSHRPLQLQPVLANASQP
jgi:hypothetical protein